jgi:hypothetical protein
MKESYRYSFEKLAKGFPMAEKQTKREYFDVFGFVKTQPQKIGYAYLTPKGSIGIKALNILDETPLGRHLKKGLCIELKDKKRQENMKGQP